MTGDDRLVVPEHLEVTMDLLQAREDMDSIVEMYLRSWVQGIDIPDKPFKVGADASGQPNRLLDARDDGLVCEFELKGNRVRVKWVLSLQVLDEIYRAALDLMERVGIV